MIPISVRLLRWGRSILGLVVVGTLLACSSAPDRPKPADLGANVPLLGVKLAWTLSVGPVHFPLDVKAVEGRVFVASSAGQLVVLDQDTGREIWRASAEKMLSAGVGTDGHTVAVVTRDHEVLAFREGVVRWRQRLSAGVQTAPLVAGGRVFVMSSDRTVTAFDGATGRRLWSQQRPGEPLVLQQSGAILAVADTLVAGFSGRLTGLNPLNGSVRWDVSVAAPRGVNDVERLVDVVGPVSRVGDSVCVRAFQAAVACVNAARGTLLWSKPASGFNGLHGDDVLVLGAESDGKLVAWARKDGSRAWVSDRLVHRNLTAPLLIGRSVAVGDGDGVVHLLSRDDGAPLNRLSTDGSGIASAPIQAGNTLVVVTRNGAVMGFKPD